MTKFIHHPRRMEGKSLRKTNLFILFIAIIVFFITFLFNFSENTTPTKKQNLPKEEAVEPPGFKVPHKGIHTFIGASEKEIKKHFGEPEHIDPTPYGYDWWIYGSHSEHYLQIGMEKGKVVTIYALGKQLPTEPFKIGEDANHIIKKVDLADTVTFNYKGSRIEFEFKEDEMMVSPLVRFGKIWVQLYIDHFTNRLMCVRYLTSDILIKQRPYTIVYEGKLDEAPEPTEKKWDDIQNAEAREIFNITNILRMRQGLDPLQWNAEAAQAAYQHSREMMEKHYFAHESKWSGGPGDRLHQAGVDFTMAGENIAAGYPDGISAVIGWMNSEDHRKNLFNPSFTDLGVGVYHKYYTQDFVKLWIE
ncbi:CAP domain-containing protein [Caenibacillus caldisaponilyticus]|uniref:CAP domain-containing protein n=1 Tax=Caenibacillus caldisaponilyticus TaxID=1674942 RepID=UPI000988833A|nr:CAP domain-containing protein [Caenibacillus caldisaponilyticus]